MLLHKYFTCISTWRRPNCCRLSPYDSNWWYVKARQERKYQTDVRDLWEFLHDPEWRHDVVLFPIEET